MTWLTVDGSDDMCRSCERPVVFAAGEGLTNGENHWFVEQYCAHCRSSRVEQGSGFLPAWNRDLVLGLLGRWRIRVDQGSDLAILRCLRRVYGLTIAETKQRREELLRTGLSGTRGEMVWLEHELADLGVAATVGMEAAGTQAELPERQMPPLPGRLGGAAGSPSIMVADQSERLRVAEFIGAARCLVAGGGLWIDPVTRDPRDLIGFGGIMTDGTFEWPLMWATLLARHALPLPEDFVAHVRAHDYEPPILSDDELRAIEDAIWQEMPEEA